MYLMKLLMLFLLLILVFCYLYFSYIHFYNFIGSVNLKSPFTQNSFVLSNSQGSGEVKYVALGDSLSAGVGSSNVNDTFVYQYALNLPKKYQKVDLLNLAYPGSTTADVVSNQLSLAVEENPDYVTLLIGTNDIHNRVSVGDFKDRYQFIINELLTKTDSKIVILTIPYLGSSKIVYPPFNFLLDFKIKQFNKIILDISQNERIKIVDLYKEKQMIYSPDLFHPSGAGYLIWSKIINAN